jgi:hypothetical protein
VKLENGIEEEAISEQIAAIRKRVARISEEKKLTRRH